MSVENFTNFKYGSGNLSDVQLTQIKKICGDVFNSREKRSANSKLAGNIEYEYVMPIQAWHVIKKSLCEVAEEITGCRTWNIDYLWANYQKKYEFNPFHNHSGVLSFVIWIQIPYNLDDEMNLDFVKFSNSPCASLFSLFYVNPVGSIEDKTIPLDKKDEGKFLIFPSNINHMVYPFYTSDDYRISISGNMTPSDY